MDTALAADVERRHRIIREAAERDGLDAVLVCASEYTGFEGAMFYVSGFRILHRYAYVLLPVEESPTNIFPGEGRWVGDHAEGWVHDRVFADTPGKWIAERMRDRGWKRLGVYGMDLVMTVRDFAELPSDKVVWNYHPITFQRGRGCTKGGCSMMLSVCVARETRSSSASVVGTWPEIASMKSPTCLPASAAGAGSNRPSVSARI